MKRLFTVMMMALAGSSAFAQWNTNATPTCLMGIEYTDPETGEVRKGGDYYICEPKVARTPDKKTWISWKTWGHKKIRDINRYAVRTYLQLLDRDGNPQFEEPIILIPGGRITHYSWLPTVRPSSPLPISVSKKQPSTTLILTLNPSTMKKEMHSMTRKET